MKGYKAWKTISGWVCFGFWAVVVLSVVLGASGGVRPSRARGAGPTVGTQACVLPPYLEDVKVGGRYGREVDRRVRAEWRQEERNGLSWDVALPVVEAGPPEGRRAFREWMERAVGRRVEEEIRGFEEFVEEEKARDDGIPAEDLRETYELRYAVGYLDDRLVSVLVCEDIVARWAAHPSGSAWVVNFRLDEGRPLEAAEMFRGSPEAAWLRYCARRITEQIDEECEDIEIVADILPEEKAKCDAREREVTEHLRRRREDWGQPLLTADGLIFVFNEFSHAVGEVHGCLVPWRKAVRLLRPEFRRRVGLR